ncbi:MAG: pyridoxal-phosphate dependent enzyme [Planctomycetota bacterium]|jgi:D-cysteine desulfhydrase
MEVLLSRFPGLKGFPHVDFGVRPTPVEEHTIEGRTVLVKRDDRIGGNKVRTLEFLLARRAKRLLTFSTLAAHHAHATAECGRRLGIPTDVVLVRRGPRASQPLDGRVIEVGGALRAALAGAWLWRPGTRVIWPGGMSARGALGYLVAALELDEVPGRIYVPMGSGTTASGLLAGLMLRQAKTEVVAVRVAEPVGFLIWRRAHKAVSLLRKHDPSVPRVVRGGVSLRIVKAPHPYGEGPVPDAGELHLEPSYSGPTLRLMLDEGAEGALFVLTCRGSPA